MSKIRQFKISLEQHIFWMGGCSITHTPMVQHHARTDSRRGDGTSGGGGLMVTGWDVLRGGEGLGCTCCWTVL